MLDMTSYMYRLQVRYQWLTKDTVDLIFVDFARNISFKVTQLM